MNTYQDFKNVFNAKSVGGSKTNRRSLAKRSIDNDDVRASQEGNLSARERVMKDKERRRIQEQGRHEQELERIRIQNVRANIEA